MRAGEDGKSSLARAGAFARRNWIAIRSWLLFGGTLTVWLIWYPKLVDSRVLSGYMEFTARLTGSVLRLFGSDVEVSGAICFSPDFSMRIGHECTAIVSAAILFCAVLAYPSGIRQKLVCMAIGLPALFLLNLVRTVTLYYIGVHMPDFFDTAHFVVWQSVMILAVVALWLLWAGRLVNVRAS